MGCSSQYKLAWCWFIFMIVLFVAISYVTNDVSQEISGNQLRGFKTLAMGACLSGMLIHMGLKQKRKAQKNQNKATRLAELKKQTGSPGYHEVDPIYKKTITKSNWIIGVGFLFAILTLAGAGYSFGHLKFSVQQISENGIQNVDMSAYCSQQIFKTIMGLSLVTFSSLFVRDIYKFIRDSDEPDPFINFMDNTLGFHVKRATRPINNVDAEINALEHELVNAQRRAQHVHQMQLQVPVRSVPVQIYPVQSMPPPCRFQDQESLPSVTPDAPPMSSGYDNRVYNSCEGSPQDGPRITGGPAPGYRGPGFN